MASSEEVTRLCYGALWRGLQDLGEGFGAWVFLLDDRGGAMWYAGGLVGRELGAIGN